MIVSTPTAALSLHSCIEDRYCIFMSNCAQSRADDKKSRWTGTGGQREEQKLIDKRGEREEEVPAAA